MTDGMFHLYAASSLVSFLFRDSVAARAAWLGVLPFLSKFISIRFSRVFVTLNTDASKKKHAASRLHWFTLSCCAR